MTKKHFIAIADAIRLNGTFSESQIETLGAAFKAINPHFNRYRWTQYIKGNCGPNGGAI